MLSTPEKVAFVLAIIATPSSFPAPRPPLPDRAGRAPRTGSTAWPGASPRAGQDPAPALHPEKRAAVHRPDARPYLLRRPDLRHHDVNHTLEGFIPAFISSAVRRWRRFSLASTFRRPGLVGVSYFAFRRFIVRPKAMPDARRLAVIYAALAS